MSDLRERLARIAAAEFWKHAAGCEWFEQSTEAEYVEANWHEYLPDIDRIYMPIINEAIEQARADERAKCDEREKRITGGLQWIKSQIGLVLHKFERADGIWEVALRGVQLGAPSWASNVENGLLNARDTVDTLLAGIEGEKALAEKLDLPRILERERAVGYREGCLQEQKHAREREKRLRDALSMTLDALEQAGVDIFVVANESPEISRQELADDKEPRHDNT